MEQKTAIGIVILALIIVIAFILINQNGTINTTGQAWAQGEGKQTDWCFDFPNARCSSPTGNCNVSVMGCGECDATATEKCNAQLTCGGGTIGCSGDKHCTACNGTDPPSITCSNNNNLCTTKKCVNGRIEESTTECDTRRPV